MQTMDENSAFRPQSSGAANYSYQNPKKPNKIIFIVLFLVLLAGVGFGFWKYFLDSEEPTTKSITITPTPTEFQFPTDTPTPSPSVAVSPTLKPTSTPTSKPTTNPVDSATGLDRSAISVEVQNGSGEAGAAGKAADYLKGLGYKISSTGNADNYDYVNVTIQVKNAASKYLSLLKKDLGFNYTVGTTSADLASSFSSDALVIIGK